MDLLNKLGAASFITTIIALYLLGVPDKMCYIFFTFSMLMQSYVFWKTKQWFLMVQMVVLIAFQVIIPWVRITPLGKPVVPEV